MKKSVRIFWTIFLAGLGAIVLVIVLAMMGAFGKLPSLKELENPSIVQASEVYATDGTLMGKYYMERGNRTNAKYRDISRHVINALVATEDERFYDHSGIDFKSTLRAIILAGKEGGGSTITQQLAKTLLDQGSKNFIERVIEKLKEYIVAIRLERNFTKEEILALYLNAVPFPDNVYGIRNASRTFFSKEPDRLNIEEAALLVGTLKGNTIYNPKSKPANAIIRRNEVLGQMHRNKYLTNAEVSRLSALPIKLNYKRMDENTGYAPYFREVLKEEVKKSLKDLKKADGEEYNIYNDGLKIYTTINPRMQEYAEAAVAQQMPLLQNALNRQTNIRKGTVWKGRENVLESAMKASDRWNALKAEGELTEAEIRKTFYKKVQMKIFAWNARREKDTVMTPMDSIKYHRQMLQSAFMVMDPVTGEVKAWVGGINFKTYKFDHANIRTKRQVGSTIKPLLYCQAIEERGMSPESMVVDQQQIFNGKDLVPATGATCTGRTMTMASALAWSRNCATAYIMKQVGPAQFSNFLAQLNIPTKVAPFPSIALGSCDLSLFEMMWAYSIFPGHGFSTKPYFITRIEDRNGNVIRRFDFSQNRKEVVSEVTAYKMCKMMEGPVTKGTAAGLMYRLNAKEMGGKTGTTNDNADAWFMGYTPQLEAGVWIGSDDRFIRIESAQGYGGTAARPIWEAFFKMVYENKDLGIDRNAVFAKPASLDNEISNASISDILTPPAGAGAEGVDQGVGNADDYGALDSTYQYIGPESRAPVDENAVRNKPVKKDTTRSRGKEPRIGEIQNDDKKEKKGIFRKIFGGKNKEEEPRNDY